MRHLNTSRRAASLFGNSDILCLVMPRAIGPKLFLRPPTIVSGTVRTYSIRAVSVVIYWYTCHHTRLSRNLEVTATLLFDTHNQSCRTPGVPPFDISTKYSVREIAQYQPLHCSCSQPRHSTKFCPTIMPRYGRIEDHGCTGRLAWARGDANYKSKVSTWPPRALWPFQTRIPKSASSLETTEMSLSVSVKVREVTLFPSHVQRPILSYGRNGFHQVQFLLSQIVLVGDSEIASQFAAVLAFY
jgi:hypothetical protein